MKRNGFRSLVSAALISGSLTISAVMATAQTADHLPAAGEMKSPMHPNTPLPYSWEIGKHRNQKFGDYQSNKPSKAVRRLLKGKAKAEKKAAKNQ